MREVFWSTIVATGIAGVILSAIGSFLISAIISSKSRSSSGCGLFAGIFIVALVLSGVQTYTRSVDSINGAWEAKRDELKNYRQKIHGWVIDTKRDVYTCEFSSTSESGTGCKRVWESCTDTYDSQGKKDGEDCDYTPQFKEEYAYKVFIKTGFKDQWVLLGEDHMAPPNFNDSSTWYSTWSRPDSLEPNEYEIPADYTRAVDGLAKKQVVPGSFWDIYPNFMYGSDEAMFKTLSSDLDRYAKAGILPTINLIRDRGYGYNFVQFTNLNIPEAAKSDWETKGEIWFTNAGPKLEASAILFFVDAKDVDFTQFDSLITASKAFLTNKDKWQKDMLPKNAVVIGCSVDTQANMIRACGLETGMPWGNENVKEEFRAIRDIPFTPEAFFGKFSAQYVQDEKGLDVDVKIDQPGILAKLYDGERGFKRESMSGMAFLDANIQPTSDQRNQIVWAAVWATIVLDAIVIAVIFGALAKLMS